MDSAVGDEFFQVVSNTSGGVMEDNDPTERRGVLDASSGLLHFLV
jgi:hypothetical protein